MTAAQMKDLFLVLYDKVTNLAAPGYTDDEIAQFLNKAQLQFVKQRYNHKGNKYRDGFEKTEKRRKDLSELTRNADLGSASVSGSQTGVSPNGIFYDLPTDFLYALREEITISSSNSCVDGNRISVKPVTHDEYTINIDNPFKKPDTKGAWRLDFSRESVGSAFSKRHEVITDGSYTVTTYHLRYLKKPIDIDITNNVDSELEDSVHEEIVDMAVRIATGITDPQSYQVKIAEESKTE
jgi:hypothetical protein